MRATHDDLEDPLLRPSAFSLVPRTLAVAGFSSTTVSMEILSNQASHLIESVRDITSKVPTSLNACADSDAIQKEKEVIINKELKPRLRAQFRPMPDTTKNADVATVDYSILKHIKDHVEFFKTAEDLENAEKELRRLRGEPSPEKPPPRPRRTGLTRTSKSYTFNIDTTILKNALGASRDAPKDSNSTNKGLNAIPLEVSNPKEDTSVIDTLLSNMKNAAEGEEEALIWQSLNLKPTDISRLSTPKLPRFINNNNPIISTNKGCITPETSYEKTISRSPLEALLDLQRKIMQRNPSFVPPIDDDDDSIIGSPFASTSGVCVSPKDNFKSKEKHSNELTNEIASTGKFASIVDQLSFQDKENIIPDVADNTIEGIALQNQVPEVPQGEVDKDVSSGYENAQNISSPLEANKTDNRLGNDTLDAVDHEDCLDHEARPQNINVIDGDYPGMGDDDNASLLENIADATDKVLEVPQDVAGGKEVSKDHQSSQSKASSIDVSLENALVDLQEQEKLVPEESAGKKGKKRGGQAKQNKGNSKAKPKTRSDDQVDVPLQNPPERSNMNIQVAPEESQVRKGKKRVAVRQTKGSLDMQQPEMPPQVTESEVQAEDSHMESPREKKKLKASPKKQNKRESNKSLADGGLGVRRSIRVKSRPLQHWLGERFIYGRVDDSLATVIGVQAYSPTSKGPVMKVKSFVSGKYTALLEKQVGK